METEMEPIASTTTVGAAEASPDTAESSAVVSAVDKAIPPPPPKDEHAKHQPHSPDGLTDAEVEKLRAEFGYNEVVTKSEPIWKQILWKYVDFIPIIMILTAIISVAVEDSTGNRSWFTFALLMIEVNLIVIVDWYSERNAGDAVAELKRMSAPECTARRNGEWKTIPVRELVPGDVVLLTIGAVIPADAEVLQCDVELSIDESSLTGESLPVAKNVGDELLSGGVLRQGEGHALILRTGENTFFGKTLVLLTSVNSVGRLQRSLRKIGNVLSAVGAVLELVILFVIVFRDHNTFGEALVTALAIYVSIVPIGMSLVATTTMAIGARELTKQQAVVMRLSAIEELAGMEILCSDKTGTLTLNVLQLHEPWLPDDRFSYNELLLMAALASKRDKPDAIDTVINNAIKERKVDVTTDYHVNQFMPFNPVDKRTEARVTDLRTNSTFRVTKGAPHIIRSLASSDQELQARIDDQIIAMASRGFRTLGVAISYDNLTWEFVGLLTMHDPPRHDTKATIEQAHRMGVDVKMITGDQRAIAIETARQLGMGTNILGNDVWNGVNATRTIADLVEEVSGFAGVYPEHKFAVVQLLQEKKYVVGMTGDGVNDAPALKRADIGIAVAGATDAAKAAADIVLLAPGLSVIITAMVRSRKIFQRLLGYIMYRVASSVLIQFFFLLSILAMGFYMPTWVLIILSLINDFAALSTAKDYVHAAPHPEKLNMPRMLALSSVIGVCGVAASFLFVYLASPQYVNWWSGFNLAPLTQAQVVAAQFLCLATLIQTNLFITRTSGFFFSRRPAVLVCLSVSAAVLVSLFIAVYWPQNSSGLGGPYPMSGIGWLHALVTLFYNVLAFLFTDVVKVLFIRYGWPEESEAESAVHESSRNDILPAAAQASLVDLHEAATAGGASHPGLQRQPSLGMRRMSLALAEEAEPTQQPLRRRDVLAMNARRLAERYGFRRLRQQASSVPAATAGRPSMVVTEVTTEPPAAAEAAAGTAPAGDASPPRRPTVATTNLTLGALERRVSMYTPRAAGRLPTAGIPPTPAAAAPLVRTQSVYSGEGVAAPVDGEAAAALAEQVAQLQAEQHHMRSLLTMLERNQVMIFRFLMGDLCREDVLSVLHASGYNFGTNAVVSVAPSTSAYLATHGDGTAAAQRPARTRSGYDDSAANQSEGGSVVLQLDTPADADGAPAGSQ